MTTTDSRQKARSSFRGPVPIRGFAFALLAIALFSGPAGADDADIAKLLKEMGAEVTMSDGVVTGLAVKDGSKLTDDDFRQLVRLGRLKTLDLSDGLNDERLSQLAALEGLEYLQTNLAQVTDDGLKPLGEAQESGRP